MQKIPVFFCEEMVANAESFSPSAGKPALAVAAWQAEGLPINLRTPLPASRDDLVRVHDEKFVDGVLSCAVANGFGNRRKEVAASLPWTSGAMLSAAYDAVRTGSVACAPVSGFHHAGFAQGHGFCTFNGLMVTAGKLLTSRVVGRVLILDCDMHYGDGTDDILGTLDYPDITHHTFGEFFHSRYEGEDYLEKLKEVVKDFGEHDLILYQAGADVHVDDPLGGVLTTEQMTQRDRIVFEAAFTADVPVVWNLAGGYQTPIENVLALHINTMRECFTVFGS